MILLTLYKLSKLTHFKHIIQDLQNQKSQNMDNQEELPQKRFQDYQQVFNSEGIAIGFTLPGSEFLFKYDEERGWKDQKGNYYNSKGVLQKVADGVSDEDQEQIQDDEELEQFERMLDDEGQPQKKQKKQPVTKDKKPEQPNDYKTETTKLLQNYKNKAQIRQGLPEQLHIFFKMRSKFYQRVQPQVQRTQSINQSNELIKKIKAEVEEKTKSLRQKNKWISQNTQFQYSGTQLDQATYDRYWYGIVKTTPEKYAEVVAEIEKSQEFALLDHKSFYALKSKFYLKKKMQETIKDLSTKLEGLGQDSLVKIYADNLPENFPVSFIFDLCSFSGTSSEEIYSVKIVDDFKAEIVITKSGAKKFLNVQGYCHDPRQYIELEVQHLKQEKKLTKSGMFKVSVNTNKKNPYKTHTRQLHDTLAIQKSKEGLVKLYPEEEQNTNGGFRLIIGDHSLKKILMFRGASLDVLKIEVFEKK